MSRSSKIRSVLWLLGTLAYCFLLPEVAEAATDYTYSPANRIVEEQFDRLQTEQVHQYWDQLMEEYGEFFPDAQTPSFMDMILPAGEGFKPTTIFLGVIRFFLHELLYNAKLLVTIVLLTVFSMILQTIQGAFQSNAVSKVAYAITFIVLALIALNSFTVAAQYAKSAITSMIHFMIAVAPLLLTLLASMGNIASAAVFHPLLVFMIHTIGTFTYTIVFPLLFFSAVLHIVSSLSEKYKVTQLANLLRRISLSLLAVMMTIFLGIISVQGASASVADGVTIRTAKYITGNFVPIVGRMFSEAGDTVIGASLLVKNAIGLAGVIIIVFLCAFPALKILAMVVIYQLTAAIMQPLGDSPIVNCLSTIAKTMVYIFAALALVCLMFFLAVTMLIAAGNLSVMMR